MNEYYCTIIVEYSNQGMKRLDSFVTPFTNERTSQECRPRSACQDQIKWFENRFQRTEILLLLVRTLWNSYSFFSSSLGGLANLYHLRENRCIRIYMEY